MTIAQVTISENIDAIALRAAIEGVEDNNRINSGSWSDWSDADHVGDTYGAELCQEGAQIIERAIASNGSSLALDLPAVERAVWGQNFSGSFWDRA